MSAPFAQINQGPPSTTGKVTSPDALYLDRMNAIAGVAGDANQYVALQCVRNMVNAQTALTNVTTAQTLYTFTLGKGELNMLNRSYTLSGYAIYTSPGTTAPVLTFALTLGGVTIATITCGALNTTASTNMPIQFEFTITVTATGSSGSVEVHGEVDINLTANTPAGVLSYYPDTNAAVITGINLTAADVLALTVAASSTVTSIQLRQAWLEVLL